MKALLIFVSVAIPLVFAGVGRLTPEVEDEAYRLWNEHCSGKREGGEDGQVRVYCKISEDTEEVKVNTELTVTPKPATAKQAIFIKPPKKNIDHDVVVKGSFSGGQKTVIFIVPSNVTNNYNVSDNTQTATVTEKPVVFFLKKEPEPEQEETSTEPADQGEGGYEPESRGWSVFRARIK